MVHQHPFTIVVFYLLRVNDIVYQDHIKLRILACLKRTCKEVKTCIDEINWILHPEPIFDILNYTMPVINCSDIPSTNCSKHMINKLSKKWNEDSKIVFRTNQVEELKRYMGIVHFKNKNIYVYDTIFDTFISPKKKNRFNGIIGQTYNIFFINCTFNAGIYGISYQKHQNINIFFINCIIDYNNLLQLKNLGSTYFINCPKINISLFRFDNQNEIKFINCTIISYGFSRNLYEQIHINKCKKFYMCNCKISLNPNYLRPYTRFITFSKDYSIGDIIINNNIFYSIRINKNDVKHITEYYNLKSIYTNYTIIDVLNKDIDLADIARNINNNIAAFGLYYYNNEDELWIYDDIFNSNTWNSFRRIDTKFCPQSPRILIFNTKLTIYSQKNKSKMTLESPAYYNIDNNRINTLQLMYDEHSKQFKLTNNTVCKSMCVKLIIKRKKISEIQFDADKIKNKVFKLRESACHTSNLVRIFMDLFNNPLNNTLNNLYYANRRIEVYNRKENRCDNYNNFKDLIQADISNYIELKQKYIENLQSDDYLVS